MRRSLNHNFQITEAEWPKAIEAHPDDLPEIIEYLMSIKILQEMIEASPDHAAEHKP